MEYGVYLEYGDEEVHIGNYSSLWEARREARREARKNSDAVVDVAYEDGERLTTYAYHHGRLWEQAYLPARAGGGLTGEFPVSEGRTISGRRREALGVLREKEED